MSKKTFLNQTIYVLKNRLYQQSFLNRDSFLNRAFLNRDSTVSQAEGIITQQEDFYHVTTLVGSLLVACGLCSLGTISNNLVPISFSDQP